MFSDFSATDIPSPAGVLTDDEADGIRAHWDSVPLHDREFFQAHLDQYDQFRISAPRQVDLQRNAKQFRTLEDLAYNFDLATLGNGIIPKSVELAADNVEAQKAKEALTVDTFIRQRTGKHPAEAMRPVLRDAVARELFGDEKGLGTDSNFFTAAKEWATGRRAERALISGPDDDLDDGSDAARESSLFSLVSAAAMRREPFSSAYGAWQIEAQKKPGFNAAKLADYEADGKQFHARFTASMEKARPVAEKILAGLQQERASAGAYGGEALVDDVRSLPAELRPMLYAMVSGMAAKEGDAKEAGGQFFQAFGRGSAGLLVGTARTWESEALDDAEQKLDALKAGDTYGGRFPDLWSYLRGKSADGMEQRALKFLAEPLLTDKTATAPEIEAAKARIATERDRLRVGIELEQVGKGVLDPIKGKSWLQQKVIYPFAESMLPQMAMFAATRKISPAAAGGGFVSGAINLTRGAGAMVPMYGMMADQNAQQLLALNPGMGVKEAYKIGREASVAQTGLEYAQMLLALGTGSKLGQALQTAQASAWKTAGKSLVVGAIGQNAMEGAQDILPPIVQEVHRALSRDAPEVPWERFFQGAEIKPEVTVRTEGTGETAKNIWMAGGKEFSSQDEADTHAAANTKNDGSGYWSQRADTFWALLPAVVFGAGGSTMRARASRGQLEAVASGMTDVQLHAAGIPAERRTAILAETDAVRRLDAFSVALKGADKATADEGAARLQKQRQAAEGKFSAEMQRAGVTLERAFIHDEPVFKVTAPGGKVTVHGKVADAMEAVTSHLDAEFVKVNKPAMDMLAALQERPGSPTEQSLTKITARQDSAADALLAAEESGNTALADAMKSRMAVEQAKTPDAPIDWQKMSFPGQSELDVKEGLLRAVTRIEAGGSALTPLEERAETDAAAWVDSGELTWEDLADMIREVEAVTGDTYLHGHTGGKDAAQDQMAAAEGYSLLTKLYATGQGRSGAVGAAARSERAGSQQRLKEAERTGTAGPLMNRLRAAWEFFRGYMLQAARLNKARREGKLGDIETFLQKSVGIEADVAHARAVQSEAEAIYGPEGGAPEASAAEGEQSLAESAPPAGTDPGALPAADPAPSVTGFALKPRDRTDLDSLLSEPRSGHSPHYAELPLSDEQAAEIGRLTGQDTSEYVRVIDASSLRHIEKRHGAASNDPHPITNEDIRALPGIMAAPGVMDVISEGDRGLMNLMHVRFHDGWFYIAEEVRTGSGALAVISLRKSKPKRLPQAISAEAEAPTGSYTSETLLTEASERLQRALADFKSKRGFSLSPTATLDAVAEALNTRMARDPDARRKMVEQAGGALARLKSDWTRSRQTPKGHAVPPVGEKLTTGERDKKQAALVADEFDTALTSAGLIAKRPGPKSPQEQKDAWKAYRDSRSSLLDDGFSDEQASALIGAIPGTDAATQLPTVKAALESAVQKGEQWRADEDARQDKDWNDRAVLVRNLRILDAILAAFPPDVRARVGGFVTLARFTSDRGMSAEIQRRIEALDEHLEDSLKKSFLEEIKALREKAEPTREGGKSPRGKLGHEAHRFFDAVASVAGLTEAKVEARRTEIHEEAARLEAEKEMTPARAADLYEQEQTLDMFGALDTKNAAHLARALDMLQDVYDNGRNRWRIQEEARQEEVRGLIADTVKALGGVSRKAIQDQKNMADKALSLLKSSQWSIKSFTETMELLFGRNHVLALRWSRMVREGFAQRTNEIVALTHRWRAAMHRATGKKGRKARYAVWEMGREQTINVTVQPFTTHTEEIPVETFAKILAGEADAKALGLSAADVDTLTAQVEALPADSRKGFLTLKRVNSGMAETLDHTEAEGIFLSMLYAQEQYREALARSGYDAETMAEIEKQLTPAAKELRTFMQTEYRDGYEPLAQVFRRMFGVDLPQIENYAPGAFYHVGGKEASVDPFGPVLPDGGFRAGFLKDRKPHKAAPKAQSAFSTFFGHANMTAHWKALGEVTRELRAVFGNPDVKQAIEGRHGEEAFAKVSEWMTAIEGNGIQTGSSPISRAFFTVMAHSALAWKLGTLVKQSTALLGAWYRMPTGAYLKGLAMWTAGAAVKAGTLGKKNTAFWQDVQAMWKSDVIQRRVVAGFTPEVRAVMANAWNNEPHWRNAFMERGMEIIGLTDAFFTTGSAAISYHHHYRQALKAGQSEPAARRIAENEAADMVARTAQPVEVADRSLMELNLGGIGRAMFFFGSEARQKSSLWLTAWAHTAVSFKNVATGKGWTATKEDARVLFIAHMVLGPMLQAIVSMWRDSRDDDDGEDDPNHWDPMDFLIAAVTGPMGGLPMIRDVVDAHHGESGPLARFYYAGNSALQLFDGPKDYEPEMVEWYEQRLARLLQGLPIPGGTFVAIAAGIGDQAFKIGDNLFDDETERGVKQLKKEDAAEDAAHEAAMTDEQREAYREHRALERAAKIKEAGARAE